MGPCANGGNKHCRAPFRLHQGARRCMAQGAKRSTGRTRSELAPGVPDCHVVYLVSHNALVPHSEGGGREGAPQGDMGQDHLDDGLQQTGCAGASLTHLTHQTDAGGEVGAETIENGW